MHYLIAIHKDPGSSYGVIVPDLPGCFSAGETLEEALAMAKEAIEFHRESLIEDGDPIPQRQSYGYHRNNPDFADAIWGVVEVEGPRLAVPGG